MQYEVPAEFFERLEARGIDYSHIKRLVQFEFPHEMLRFSQWFRGRSCKQVIEQIDEWKILLEKDFILVLSEDLKLQVKRFVHFLQWQVIQTLIEANPYVDVWRLQIHLLQPEPCSDGRRMSGWDILAINTETDEIKKEHISGEIMRDMGLAGNAVRKAFEKLGLWEPLIDEGVRHRLTSKHNTSGWPIWTKFVIPRLYEFLLPFYVDRGHFSEKRDRGSHLQRSSLYPKALLEDMLEILRLEHPWVFLNESSNTSQLKAVIQRHLERKSPIADGE